MTDDRLAEHDQRLRHVENEVVAIKATLDGHRKAQSDEMAQIRKAVEQAGEDARENRNLIEKVMSSMTKLQAQLAGFSGEIRGVGRSNRNWLAVATLAIAILGWFYKA